MANEQNLIPLNKRSKSVQREIQEKGRQANKEKWAEKKDMQSRVKAVMEMPADPGVARGMSKLGVPIDDVADAILAGLLKSALKGDVRAFEKLMEYAGQSVKSSDKLKAFEERKAEAEAERAEMETELYKLRLEAIKGIGQEDLPDDGFLDALKSTAAEDWSDDVL